MALDKDKILSELGSVMNQLKSADCGCMGKLFSGSGGQSGMGCMGGRGCRGMPCAHHGCCHGHGDSMGGGHCMGRCNAPKLYSDTFSYLNNNLMQPVVKEVYDELSTISPQNTIGNSPMANQMGLPVSGGAMGAGAMGAGAMGAGAMSGGTLGGGAMGLGAMGGGAMGGGAMGGGAMGGEAMGGGAMGAGAMGGGAMGGGAMGGGALGGGALGGGAMGGGAMGGGAMGGGAMGGGAMSGGAMGGGAMDGEAMGSGAMGGGTINTPQGMGAHIMQMMMSGGRGRPKMLPIQGGPSESMPLGGPNSPGQGNMGMDQGNMRMAQGNMGMAQGYMGMEQGNMGMAQGNMRTAQGYMGMEKGNMGMAQGNMGMAQGNVGMAQGNMGMAKGNMGMAQGNMRMGQGNMGMEQGNMGMAQGNMGMAQGNMGMAQGNMGMAQGDPNAARFNVNYAVPKTEYVTQDNMFTVQNALPPGNAGMNSARDINQYNISPGMNMNPGMNLKPTQNMYASMPQQGTGFTYHGQSAIAPPNNDYGVHNQGISKFHEMFSGLMNGKNLGFDPMDIAVQLNPANSKQAAINKMQNVVFNKPGANLQNVSGQPLGLGQPVQQQLPPSQHMRAQQPVAAGQQQVMPGQQQVMLGQQQVMPGQQQVMPGQQQIAPSQQQIGASQQGFQPNQQQVYAAQSYTAPQGQCPQEAVDPNTGASHDPNMQYQQETNRGQTQELSKENPAEPTMNPMDHQIYYNTLGQPVEMIPYVPHIPPDDGPRALFLPETATFRPTISKALVKSTVSKTSLIGNKSDGRNPSRARLQNIYQQYKGSQSYIQPKLIPIQNVTQSDGVIRNNANVQRDPQRQIPVEKVGGDTSANNVNNVSNSKIPAGQVGDTAPSKPQEDSGQKPDMPKFRNGIQDMKSRRYMRPMWTFHGERDPWVNAIASRLGRKY